MSKVFDALDQHGPKLIGYFPAGYPTADESVEAAVAMCESGVDVLELGVPYSDPVMDGPTIAAVRDRQRKMGLVDDGVVGPLSWVKFTSKR